ncbi:MAG: hypothetical protein K6E10_09670 [Eubacterium sp.]|nr:hypothetical protein [Eubacterium sp.]
MELDIKTVSFGGYDKKATETYIAEKSKAYEDEIAKLKEDATKLSEAVKGLQQMREANMSESKSTIENLQSINEELETEVNKLKLDLEMYKKKEIESATQYESISRTLLAARVNADELTQKTEAECEAKMSETTAQCKAMMDDTTYKCKTMMDETNSRCEQLKSATESECDRLISETQSSCQEKKESTYAECESLRRKTREETDRLNNETQYRCDNLKAQTESACERLKNDTITACDEQRAKVNEESEQKRDRLKKEFEAIGGYMTQVNMALNQISLSIEQFSDPLEGLKSSVIDTKKLTERLSGNLDDADDEEGMTE